jgi:hypothetical protein
VPPCNSRVQQLQGCVAHCQAIKPAAGHPASVASWHCSWVLRCPKTCRFRVKFQLLPKTRVAIIKLESVLKNCCC